ncbi:MAG: glycosyltransferase family 4 protein, partial [Sinomicrobium sp.]|nr:glycosyltransferase family 4 protein [Sinomicrobium sp.]
LKQLSSCEVIIDLHFVIQKEKSSLDKKLTKMGIRNADTYIVHAMKTYEELRELFPERTFVITRSGERNPDTNNGAIPVIKLFHPIYELYRPDPDFDVQDFKKEHGLKQHVFLFFGFIRKYKGLHHAIKAFEQVVAQRDDVSFLICGELFWNTLTPGSIVTRLKKGLFSLAKRLLLKASDDEKNYNPLAMIDELGLQQRTKVISAFIPNEDVHKYFQAADVSVLFYSRATPSGIESLSYNFNVPVLTTNTGHFPETIQAGKNGYITPANTVEAMAETMLHFLENPVPRENVARYKNKLSWKAYAAAILNDEKSKTFHHLKQTA